jgi:hypothetical protein
MDDLLARIEAMESTSGTVTLTAGAAALSAGDVVRLSSAGLVVKAQATTAACHVLGVVAVAALAGAPVQVYLMGMVPVSFGSAPAASDRGSPCYLSGTAGKATLTPPTLNAGVALVRLGILASGDGASTTPSVILRPGDPLLGG